MLVTGFDIIFFWVARMMMLGLHLMGEVPFQDVYIHGLVRDERGAKMSKTKGNVIDPLQLIDDYGADALRLALLASTAQGRDVKFGPSRVEGYRNFVTKLWNAARFVQLNEAAARPRLRSAPLQHPLNRWIVGETAEDGRRGHRRRSEAYRFNDAALGLYHFLWDTFCDWYVELAKPLLDRRGAEAQAETRAAAAWALAQALHLLHPMAPFVTEELWQELFDAARRDADPEPLAAARPEAWWTRSPRPSSAGWSASSAPIRAARTELNVPPRRPAGAAPAGRRRRDRWLGSSGTAKPSSAWPASSEIELEDQPVPPQGARWS